jgi:hypothetical protein
MKEYILDLKLSLLATTYFAISLTNIDFAMKIIVFLLTVGYTIRRIYLQEKNKNNGNQN